MDHKPVGLQGEALGEAGWGSVSWPRCVSNDVQPDRCNLRHQPCNDGWRKQSSVAVWSRKIVFFFVLLLFLSLFFVSHGESAGSLLNSSTVLSEGDGALPVAAGRKTPAVGKKESAPPFSWSKVAGGSPFEGSREKEDKFAGSERSVEKDVSYFQIVKTLFALVLVIVVILGSLYVIKIMMGRGVVGSGDGGLVQVLATSFVGPKKAITIVRVAGEHLVLGITNSEISFLSKIESPEAIQQIESHKVTGGMPFAKIFEKFRVMTKKG